MINNTYVYLPGIHKIIEVIVDVFGNENILIKFNNSFLEKKVENIFSKVQYVIMGFYTSVVEDEDEVFSDFGGRVLLRDIIKIMYFEFMNKIDKIRFISSKSLPNIFTKIKEEVLVLQKCGVHDKRKIYEIVYERIKLDFSILKYYKYKDDYFKFGILGEGLVKELIKYIVITY